MVENTDKFIKLAPKWTGQIGGSGVADAEVETIPLASTTNLPDDTAVVATINRLDADKVATPDKEETVRGIVSGDNLVDCVRGVEGTAQAHSVGALVEILVTAHGINRMVDGILAEHEQDGTHDPTKVTTRTAFDVEHETDNTHDVTKVAMLAGTQTITGVKTFGSFPVTPSSAPTTDYQVANKKYVDDSGGTTDGWTVANEDWVYASATTITVPAGAASKYSKGDKIKLTQTTVKYFYIVGVADTVLTVTGGTSYTLTDAAISANYYSKVENPQGFPTWFNYTPTYGALSPMTWTSVTTNIAKFKISGKSATVIVAAIGTTGGTASKELTITLPVTADASTNYRYGAAVADTTGFAGWCYLSSTTVVSVSRYDTAVWGIGAGRAAYINLTYGY